MVYLLQHFEADFLLKVGLKILNSGIVLKTFTHAYIRSFIWTFKYTILNSQIFIAVIILFNHTVDVFYW